MPYEIVKTKKGWLTRNKLTKKVYGTHATKKLAESQMRLLGGVTHGMVRR